MVLSKAWKIINNRFNATKEINADPVITDGGILEQGCMAKGFGKADVKNEGGGQTNPSNIVFADYVRSKNDNNEMMIQCTAGIFTPSNKTRTKHIKEPFITFEIILLVITKNNVSIH